MKLLWNLNSVPELAELPAAERGQLVRKLIRRSFQHWQTYLAIVLAGVGSAAGWFLGETIGAPLAGLVVGSVIGCFIGNLIINQFVYSHFIKSTQ